MGSGYAAWANAIANGGAWSGIGAEVTVHRKLNNLTLTAPFVDDVQAYKVSNIFASQRRRTGR